MANHRSSLKKKHKAFKSRHATKGQIKDQNKGRIEGTSTSSSAQKHQLNKNERKNYSGQIMAQKRKEMEAKTKIFNGKNGCPRNVCIIPLTGDIESVQVVNKFQSSLDGIADPSIPGVLHIPRFKQNLRFFVPNFNNFYEILDSARAADFCLFILSATEEVEDYGEKIIRCVSSQGCTTSFGVMWGSDANDKKVKASLTSWYSHFFADSRLFNLDTEIATLANSLCQKTPTGIVWRDERPYIVAETLQVQSEGIALQGFVRGSKLNPNQLVHLPGVGDCQISQIVSQDENTWTPDSPESLSPLAEEETEMHDYVQDDVITNAGVRIEGHEYVSEIIDAEEDVIQTIKDVPKGMSDYQASWLIEGEDYGLDAERDLEAEAEMIDDEEGELIEGEESEMDDEDNGGKYDAEMEDIGGDNDGFQEYKDEKAARDDLEFPDEIDIDPNESVKDRLKRYRGVRDLRTAQWDANERDPRAPAEWPRLVSPGNLFATKNRIQKDHYEGAEVGTRVVIYLPVTDDMRAREQQIEQLVKNVSNGVAVTVYGLLQFEHKLSTVNMNINPDSEFDVSLKCKEPIIVQYGPRRMQIEPVFSTPGSQHDNDVYKMFRYLHPGQPATVSAILPIMLSHAPVVYFTPGSDPRLIGTGNVMDSNNKRIVVKTAILTGHPFKINKKIVTIRYMFFNSKDVQWFKSVPLFTKWGCSGFIKESLGTHGYFKATFDKKINPQDTVAMALYKRVWPRKGSLAEF